MEKALVQNDKLSKRDEKQPCPANWLIIQRCLCNAFVAVHSVLVCRHGDVTRTTDFIIKL